VDRKAEFPLYITASFLIYTPREETKIYHDSEPGVLDSSTSRSNVAQESSSGSDLFEGQEDGLGNNDLSLYHQQDLIVS